MKFEEAIKYLRLGKRITRDINSNYGLRFINNELYESYCIELFELLEDDWVVDQENDE